MTFLNIFVINYKLKLIHIFRTREERCPHQTASMQSLCCSKICECVRYVINCELCGRQQKLRPRNSLFVLIAAQTLTYHTRSQSFEQRDTACPHRDRLLPYVYCTLKSQSIPHHSEHALTVCNAQFTSKLINKKHV